MKYKLYNMALKNEISQRYIYIADDDEDDRSMFVEALLELDPTVHLKQACDGMELMHILHTLTTPLPEIIFLDINMPGINGFECLEEIRKLEGAIHDVRVIILSTSSDPENIDRAFKLGATFYAVKPNRFEILKSFIEDVLKIDCRSSSNGSRKFRLL